MNLSCTLFICIYILLFLQGNWLGIFLHFKPTRWLIFMIWSLFSEHCNFRIHLCYFSYNIISLFVRPRNPRSRYIESDFPHTYRFMLDLFSFLLRVQPYLIHEEVSTIEHKLFHSKFHMKSRIFKVQKKWKVVKSSDCCKEDLY